MSTITLETIAAIEEIKQLKYRYLRCLDTKDWEGLSETLSPDAASWYDSGKYSYDGREAILAFLKESLGDSRIVSRHQGHHPEIELTGDSTARGHWYLEDMVIFGNMGDGGGTELTGAAFYEDEYVKVDGRWWIARTGYRRTYEQFASRESGAHLRTMFDNAADSSNANAESAGD